MKPRILTLGALLLALSNAYPLFPNSAGPAAYATEPASPSPVSITVEAQRLYKERREQADHFVAAVLVHRFDHAIARWQTPICPLVSGQSSGNGEYMLESLSSIAKSVGAPLAPEHCQPNLFIIMSPDPATLLTDWQKRDKTLFAGAGAHAVKEFLNGPSPVRVWYNTASVATDGLSMSTSSAIGVSGRQSEGSSGLLNAPNNSGALATRIASNEIELLHSVIVAVDTRRTEGVQMQTLAAYVAMAGFAKLKKDFKITDVPSILNAFEAPANEAAALSSWDKAFLTALYRTLPQDRMQTSEIEKLMADMLSGAP